MPDVLTLVTDEAIAADFGPETARRGHAYAREGRVGSLQVVDARPHTHRVIASVTGSRERPYSVLLTVGVEEDEPDLWSRCNCPVGDQCKHGAAVAFALTEGTRREQEVAWDRRLTQVVDDLTRPSSGAGEPGDGAWPDGSPGTRALGIRVDLRATNARRWGATEPSVHLRLVQQSGRGGWVQTGITWGTLPAALVRGAHDHDHLQGLRGLYAALMGETRYAHEDPALVEFGGVGWAALREALDAGVSLVAGRGLRRVRVADRPVAVRADVVAHGDGAVLQVGVEHEGGWWTGDEVITVGRPVHGVVLLDRDPTATDLLLAPTTRALPPSLGDLLTGSEPIHLPAAGRDRWAGVLLPRLGRAVRLGSSDGSVDLQPLPAPVLELTVAWDGPAEAQLTWDWVYGEGADALRCPIDSTRPLDGLRDRAAEAGVLRALGASRAWAGRPAASALVTGARETLDLVLLVLPRLERAAVDRLRIVELERPDFRPADDDVEVHFDLGDPDHDPLDPTATDPSDPTDPTDPTDPAEEVVVERDHQDQDAPVDWLDLRVWVRIGEDRVALPEVLAALTRGDQHLLLPGGRYVATSHPALAGLVELVRAAAALREAPEGHVRVGRGDLGVWAELDDVGEVDGAAAAWVGRARALRDLVGLPRPEPTGVVSTLRDYQLQGFHWLAFLWSQGLGGILADDMGLGKTLQVLALVAHTRPTESRPFLVVAPTSVVGAWCSEAERHTPGLRVAVVTASTAKRGGAAVADLASGADVVVTTYTLLRLESEQYAAVDWAGLVLDEAQQVKNHRGKTHQAVRRVPAPFRLAVSGTPFENRLMELWSLLVITNPGLYPTAEGFARSVVRPVEREQDADALRRFRARLKPFLLRRTKELVAPDLPPKQEQVLQVQLPPRHRRLYDTHLQRERQKILGLMDDFDQNRVAIFSALTRLRQLALAPGLVDPDAAGLGSAKLDLLVDHLGEVVAEGHRALVFSQFTSYLGLVRERLHAEGLATAYLDGSTGDRAEVVRGFREGDAPVFLISLKAGGVGLTLTEADYVYVLDPWWNPAAEAQAVDRAHRIGQDRPVLVYRLVSTDTIEDKVMALKERKAALFAQVVDGDGLLGRALTAEDVRALVD